MPALASHNDADRVTYPSTYPYLVHQLFTPDPNKVDHVLWRLRDCQVHDKIRQRDHIHDQFFGVFESICPYHDRAS